MSVFFSVQSSIKKIVQIYKRVDRAVDGLCQEVRAILFTQYVFHVNIGSLEELPRFLVVRAHDALGNDFIRRALIPHQTQHFHSFISLTKSR